MTEIHHNLKKKGWSDDEIDKVINILHSDEKKQKHITIKKEMNKIVYWTGLLVIGITNIIISIVLIPFMMIVSNSFSLYIIILTIALVFGSLVNILITDIEHIERKHHTFAVIFIPIMAAMTIFISVTISQNIGTYFNIEPKNSPLISALLYAAVFILPYAFTNRKVLSGK